MQNLGNQPTRANCLATLSPRAQRMLEVAKWHREPDDRASIVHMLEELGIEPTESLIQLQLCYGGLDYHVRNNKAIGWEFDLKADLHIVENTTCLGDALYHKSAQVHFAVDTNGRIYVETWLKTDTEHLFFWEPYAESFSQLIEGDALIDEISCLWGEPVYIGLPYCEISPSSLEKLLYGFDPAFKKIDEASDTNITWWINDSIRIHYHKAWLGHPNPEKYIFSTYCKSLEIARAFARHLMNVNLIPEKEIYFSRNSKYVYVGYP